MTEPTVIYRDEPINPGLDYTFLKETGTRLVQELAGEIWTDYNEHDPGVTTLEQVCYALTELSYRAEFPMADLLTDRVTGWIDPHRQALFIPRRIFTCNPVTINDYRKLFLDRIPAIGNVWLTPVTDPTCPNAVAGLYDISLYVPGINSCSTDSNPQAIIERVRRVYCRHRNLCEDVATIGILEGIPTVVFADVTMTSGAIADTVLAELLFRIGLLLAPEVHRQTLKSLVDEGVPSDRIFNGPLLRNGFISDDQLTPKASSIPVQDIIRVMVNCPGVASVKNVRVTVQGNPPATYVPGGPPIDVPANAILLLDTAPDQPGGGYGIRLFRNGIECRPNPARVQRELEKRQADFRQTHALMPQYEEFFGVPRGRLHNFAEYYSIQNQFPNVYGIGAFGLPGDVSDRRKGQAKQFKGYLLVFEQLLADYFSQLEHTRDLYSIIRKLRKTYFFQGLERSVPNVEPLLKPNYLPGLRRIVRSQDPWIERRNLFLDFLLALYAERLNRSNIPELTCEETTGSGVGRTLIRAKLDFLHRLVESTSRRGCGFDYLAPPVPRNQAGLQIKSRIQLGFESLGMNPLLDLLNEFAVEIVDEEAKASLGRGLNRHTEHIETQFQSVVAALKKSGEAAPASAPAPGSGMNLIRGQSITTEFLRTADRIEQFRIGTLPGDRNVALVARSPRDTEWKLAGKFGDAESAALAARELTGFIRQLKSRSRQIYIVEHTLLRFACLPPDPRDVDQDTETRKPNSLDTTENMETEPFLYSFTFTAVISASRDQIDDREFRKSVRQVIGENSPAHLLAEYCFLGYSQLRQFENLYWEWRRALRDGQTGAMRETSLQLRRFLARCRCREADSAL